MAAIHRTAAFLALALCACRMGRNTLPPQAQKPWDEMDRGERAAHMAQQVLPRMRRVFQSFDPQRFADFDCTTCHGTDAEDRGYTMPNPNLPVLDPRRLYRKHRKAQHAMADFMWKKVQPEMGRLLGVTYGPKGRVNCATCHPHDPPP